MKSYRQFRKIAQIEFDAELLFGSGILSAQRAFKTLKESEEDFGQWSFLGIIILFDSIENAQKAKEILEANNLWSKPDSIKKFELIEGTII